MIAKYAVLRTLLAVPILLLLLPSAIAMEKTTLYFWEVAACPNEDIYMEGSVRFQFHATGKGYTYQAFWAGEGWGLDSDNEYLIHGKWQEVVQEQRPFVFYWNDHFQLAGKGSAPTYRLYGKVRFDELGDDGPVPDSIHFAAGDWPCPTIDFEICGPEPCSAD